MTHGLFTLAAQVAGVGLGGYLLTRLLLELWHAYQLWKARQI